MWGIILLLLVVSLISLMLKPREPFQTETPREALDIYSGVGKNFDKAYNFLRQNEQNVIAENGEFANLTAKVTGFDSVNVKNNMKVGGNYIFLPNKWSSIQANGRLQLKTNKGDIVLRPRNGVVVGNKLSVRGTTAFKGGNSEHNRGRWGTHFPWTDNMNYIRGDTEVRGNVNAVGDITVGRSIYVKGGSSEHNPGNWQTHFPWKGDNKNYIRGDTEIRGNTNNIGNLTVGKKIFIGATSGTSTTPDNTNNSDPYYLEKIISSGDRSSLRLTMNDNPDEVFEIWGNSTNRSCTQVYTPFSRVGPGSTRRWQTRCSGGEGTMQHRFQANGDAEHKGTLTVQGQTLTGADIKKLKRLR